MLSNFHFAEPMRLVFLWLVPVFAVLLWAAHRRRKMRLARALGAGTGKAPVVRVSGGRAFGKALTLLVAAALVIIAWAQPRWSFEWREVKRHGADLMVAIDVSSSMLAQDVDPSRLERAKRKVQDLLGMLEGDRVGLVAFAGDAFVECPLTEDYAAARLFLSMFDTELIPVQGTDLGKAIDTALAGLKDGSGGEDGTASQAIILITDGEDLEGKGAAAAERAKARGVKIYTVGIGSAEGAPIPLVGGGFKKDAHGDLVVTKPDEASLQRISLATGGTFVRSVAGDMDLAQLYRGGIKSVITDKDFQTNREKLWHERFQWFLGAALLLLILEFFWRDVLALRAPGALVLLAALGLTGLTGGTARAAGASDAERAFDAGNYADAAKGFQEAESQDPNSPEHAYNRAVSQYRLKDYQGALDGFAKGARSQDPPLRRQSLFNLGNSQVALGDLDGAIKSYEEALGMQPSDQRVRDNLEHVRKLKEQQKRQQQDQKNNHNQKEQNEQQKQDQQQGQNQNEPKQDQKEAQEQKAQPNQSKPGSQGDPDQSKEGQQSDPAQGQAQNQSDAQQSQTSQGKDEQSQAQNQKEASGLSNQQKDQQGSDAQKKDRPSTASAAGPREDEQQQKGDQTAAQQAAQSDQEKQSARNEAQQQQASQGGRAQAMTGQQYRMSREEAERVLRSVDDDPRRFIAPQGHTQRTTEPEKDW